MCCFPNVVAKRHIWGARVRTQGAMTTKLELGQDFYTMHLPPSSSSYVYSFGSYHVEKQTDAAENIQRSSLRYDVGLLGNKQPISISDNQPRACLGTPVTFSLRRLQNAHWRPLLGVLWEILTRKVASN